MKLEHINEEFRAMISSKSCGETWLIVQVLSTKTTYKPGTIAFKVKEKVVECEKEMFQTSENLYLSLEITKELAVKNYDNSVSAVGDMFKLALAENDAREVLESDHFEFGNRRVCANVTS